MGLSVVYGMVHKMGGFVKIEADYGGGTTIRVTIPQQVVDEAPCFKLDDFFRGDIIFHVRSDKYKVARLRDFYRAMAVNLASGIKVSLYPADTINEIERLMKKLNVTHIFMGALEYEQNASYFDDLSRRDVVVAVSAPRDFRPTPGSRVIIMPRPLYAYPVIKILNEGKEVTDIEIPEQFDRPNLLGVRALVVDDEVMNLVVASGLFNDYGMIVDTAGSGKEAINKFYDHDYDVIFMDHMMPEMDGVEAMKRIKQMATQKGVAISVVVLTANVVSDAREMFVREGFDGFIAKPINLAEFERVMAKVLPDRVKNSGGGRS